MMERLICSTALIIAVTFTSNAQQFKELTLDQKLQKLTEKRIEVLKADNDKDRKALNDEFLEMMRIALNDPVSFKTSFDTIPKIGDLESGDGFFRMINWNLAYSDETNDYFCFLQYEDFKEKKIDVVELKEGYRNIKGEERKTFKESDWYGALYYKIIPSKSTRKKKSYMVLGWDGNDQYSSIKIVDVMTITERGVRFGGDLFSIPGKNARRMILEYKSDAAVSLRYEPRKKRIIFNELVPMEPDLEGSYAFYIPIMKFNALVWKRGKWTWEEGIDARLNTGDRPYVDPPSPQNTGR